MALCKNVKHCIHYRSVIWAMLRQNFFQGTEVLIEIMFSIFIFMFSMFMQNRNAWKYQRRKSSEVPNRFHLIINRFARMIITMVFTTYISTPIHDKDFFYRNQYTNFAFYVLICIIFNGIFFLIWTLLTNRLKTFPFSVKIVTKFAAILYV